MIKHSCAGKCDGHFKNLKQHVNCMKDSPINDLAVICRVWGARHAGLGLSNVTKIYRHQSNDIGKASSIIVTQLFCS